MRLFDEEWEPDSDTWYTPRSIFVALGLRFTIDVAAPPGGVPWVPADRYFTEADDGLTMPWKGPVWCNPPYSSPAMWSYRMVEHRNGVLLIPGDTSTEHTQRVLENAGAVCFIAGRLRFVRDAETTSARFPSLLAGFGELSATAVAGSRLGWVSP